MLEAEAITRGVISLGAERGEEGGFTLIEVMVALALMALISLAGFSLLQGVLGARERTEGRLERLGAQQRAMFVLTQDFEQITGGPLAFDGKAVTFERQGGSSQAARLPLAYAFKDGMLERRIGGGDVAQPLLTDVTAVSWSFYADGAWREVWPPADATQPVWPRAVAVDVTLANSTRGPGGHLRRVIELPTRPAP